MKKAVDAYVKIGKELHLGYFMRNATHPAHIGFPIKDLFEYLHPVNHDWYEGVDLYTEHPYWPEQNKWAERMHTILCMNYLDEVLNFLKFQPYWWCPPQDYIDLWKDDFLRYWVYTCVRDQWDCWTGWKHRAPRTVKKVRRLEQALRRQYTNDRVRASWVPIYDEAIRILKAEAPAYNPYHDDDEEENWAPPAELNDVKPGEVLFVEKLEEN